LSLSNTIRKKIEHSLATTIRAIAMEGTNRLTAATAAQNLSADFRHLSRLADCAGSIDITEARGNADAIALKLRYHDTSIHQELG
jgi:hypothetical protein